MSNILARTRGVRPLGSAVPFPFHCRNWLLAPMALMALLCASTQAQYAERSSLVGSGAPDVDSSGRSVKDRRVRAIHSADPLQEGGTAWLFARDPYLAYQLGRNLNFLEFTEKHGIFDKQVSNLLGPMPDGTTRKITANNQTSCLGCHNLPSGNPGGGPNFSKDSGRGRNSPHYYGGGIVEMLAIQVRTDLLAQADADGNGWISAAEAAAAPANAVLRTTHTAGGESVHYGSLRLLNGKPQLNNIFRVWYVDAQGRHVPGATSVNGTTTHGYNFEMVVWGWGQGAGRSALNPTNRAFFWDPMKTHGGLESHDPSTTSDPDGDGVSAPTLAGAIQFPATHKPADKGLNMDPLGFSRDDPDQDGTLSEITEGDLDLAEWFMLNAPRPAFAGTPAQYSNGVDRMRQLGCTSCHAADWLIASKDATHAGDRRFFDLVTSWDSNANRLTGRLVPLYTQTGAVYQRNFAGFTVRGIFSDLKHHEMGAGFAEQDFAGHVNTLWRTPMLWGVGSGFPWGHDGASLTIEDAILRHGGEAAASRAAYLNLSSSNRAQLIDFLGRLQLYDIESLPADIDGNGQISANFMVAGRDTLRERFNAEWLFRVPVAIQGLVTNSAGVSLTSFAATNIEDAYGRNLLLRRDSDADCWPDVWDHAPLSPGTKDGVNP